MRKIKVLIADDHTLVRDGIRSMLNLVANVEVIGEAKNGKEAVEKTRQLAPDVVLMDLAMPTMSGLDATRKIRRESPRTKVLALTQYDDNEYVIPVIEAGARGFVTKMAAFSELASAIQAVYNGDSFLSPSAATALVEECQQKIGAEGEKDPYQQLTDRERETLRLVVEGYTTKEIADTLVVSPKTVEWYKSSLRKKLNINNRTELIKFAIRKGLITV
ncbi:MAG TPA: response regulator transcription factor [Dehalococcoidia bacterium]|nr:response regulator transcription factor [Dehalococcoidia bacterium]